MRQKNIKKLRKSLGIKLPLKDTEYSVINSYQVKIPFTDKHGVTTTKTVQRGTIINESKRLYRQEVKRIKRGK